MRTRCASYLLPIGFVCVLGAGAALRESPPAGTIGVADVGKIFDSYGKWRDMQKLMGDRREIRGKEIETLASEVDKLRADLEKLDPTSKEYVQAQGLVIQKQALAETMTGQYDLELGRSEEAQYKGVAAEIGVVVGAVAKERGLTIVLQRALDAPEGSWESVLYADPRCDLTDEVTGRLNKQYETEKK